MNSVFKLIPNWRKETKKFTREDQEHLFQTLFDVSIELEHGTNFAQQKDKLKLSVALKLFTSSSLEKRLAGLSDLKVWLIFRTLLSFIQFPSNSTSFPQEMIAQAERLSLESSARMDLDSNPNSSSQLSPEFLSCTLINCRSFPFLLSNKQTKRDLIQWIEDQKILEHIFDSNIHIEVMRRSLDILKFFSRHERINAHILSLIWKPCEVQHNLLFPYFP